MLTKIIATIGPSSQSYETFKQMALSGMRVMRANMSHCTKEELDERMEFVKKLKEEEGIKITVLADLQGPRIRVKNVPKEGINVESGDKLTFVTSDGEVKEGEIGVDDPYLHTDVKIDDVVLIANGAIESIVKEIDETNYRFVVEFLNEGTIYPNKGLNMPMTKLTTSCLTDKDKEDIEMLKDYPIDYMALSFVQTADDVHELRALIDPKVKIIVKVERQEAVNNINDIINESDGIMVARGDLGVEIPMAEVPIIQKQIIRNCHLRLKPVIVATQMLSNMVKEPSPTRAEVSDIANAVMDGAHSIMLSDETANGKYPVEAVRAMANIVATTEKYLQY